MRLRIIKTPINTIDGVSLSGLYLGHVYDVGNQVSCVLLAEGWAEPVGADEPLSLPRVGPVPAPVILVVDDDREVRRLTESVLRAHGYDVRLAPDGAAAIAELRAECPALIVLDLNMPVMDAWQFRAEQRYLTGKAATVPVLLLTADENASAHAGVLGAVGTIKKPFDADDLMDAVSAVMRAQRTGPDGIGFLRPWTRRTPPAKP